MNQFYIVEGNKRVSVLKYFGAPTITGHVIRILPPKSNDKETRLYYEFVDFYRFSQINYLRFTKEGSYAKLQKLIGKHPERRSVPNSDLYIPAFSKAFKNLMIICLLSARKMLFSIL